MTALRLANFEKIQKTPVLPTKNECYKFKGLKVNMYEKCNYEKLSIDCKMSMELRNFKNGSYNKKCTYDLKVSEIITRKIKYFFIFI